MHDLSTTHLQLPGWIERARLQRSADPIAARLRAARVTAEGIAEPAQHDPRISEFALSLPAIVPANQIFSPGKTMPYAKRPDIPRGKIARTSLKDFTWRGPPRYGIAKGFVHNTVPRVCPDHLVLWVSEGSLRLELPRIDRLILSGTITYIPAGTAFSLIQLSGCNGEVLTIPSALIGKAGTVLPDEITNGRPSAQEVTQITALFEKLDQLPPIRNSAMISAAALPLNRLALALFRLEEIPSTRPPAPDDPMIARPLVERFMRLAQRDLNQGLTLADFAQMLMTSTGSLDRACRCCRGIGALDLLYALRLERAVRLLKRRDRNLVAVAAACGYVGLSHMKRAFKAATGRAPEDFQRDFC